MSEKPTAADAEIIMRLYDLRREAEMRKARHWFASAFWPKNADDVVQVINNANPQENAWFRQVNGYWEMAASFVLRGALNENLFFDSGTEMWFTSPRFIPSSRKSARKPTRHTFSPAVRNLRRAVNQDEIAWS
jgi:hypothetical protein